MCILIDTNCFSSVFKRNSKDHSQFEPVLKWILEGKGVIVVGGDTYMNELRQQRDFLTLIRLLKDIGKVYFGDTVAINDHEKRIRKAISDPDFDDPHLPAIVLDTSCKLICSKDKRSVNFVKMACLYPNKSFIPVYYSGNRNKKLLSEAYISEK